MLEEEELLVVLEEESEQVDVAEHCCHHCLAQTAFPPVLAHPLSLRVLSSRQVTWNCLGRASHQTLQSLR